MRSYGKSVCSLVLIVAVGFMLLSACAPAATPTVVAPTATPVPPTPTKAVEAPTPEVGPKPGGTLIYGHAGTITSFSPFRLPVPNFDCMNLVFNVLTRYNQNMEPQPELAESWEFSEDGLSLTLHLRQGVKYHSGRDFTAEDVKFSVEAAQSEEAIANIKPLALGVASVEVVDDYTAVLHFANPYPAIFDLLDLVFMVDEDTFAEPLMPPNVVGTGPFKLVDWAPGEYIKYTKFEDYWKEGLPYLDAVTIQVLENETAMVMALEGGSLDMIRPVPYEHYLRLKDKEEIIVVDGLLGSLVEIFQINVTKPPFDNVKVRQAMQYALDREGIVDAAFMGVPPVWIQGLPPGNLGTDPALEGYYTFDLDKAKELLTEAGYPDGFEVDLMVGSWWAGWPEKAEKFQADLAKIGVDATLRMVDAAEYYPTITETYDYQITTMAYGRANKDPASMYGTAKAWTVTANIGQYCSEAYPCPEWERLIEEGATTMDPDKRREIYYELAKIALDESFLLVNCPRADAFARQPYVKGLDFSMDNMPIYDEMWLDK